MIDYSDKKLRSVIRNLANNDYWYITKQNCNFRDLCYMANILEKWNDSTYISYQNYFDQEKVKEPYSNYIRNTPHRATKNCEFAGLTKSNSSAQGDQYKTSSLTDLYFNIKKLCEEDFSNTTVYQHLINQSIMNSTTISSNGKEIKPLLFTFKVLLLLGDVTGDFKMSTREFKIFCSTTYDWNEYFEVVTSIIRYRNDKEYQSMADNNAPDTRYNQFIINHEYIDSSESNCIKLNNAHINDVRKIVAEYELGENIDIKENYNKPSLNLEDLKDEKFSNFKFYLSAIRTKPFILLAGISGTGKSRIVRKLAQATVTEELQKKYDKNFTCENFDSIRWELHRPANFELIQVKPNWHNSMDVVGYLSNIPEPHYVFTPFIEFIAKAWQNPNIPFFLCLDEMNLAPVEEYFAEFLSAIESRSKENGIYKTDSIIKAFKSFGDDVCKEMLNCLFPEYKADDAGSYLNDVIINIKESGLSLPENLIVIGTVNMDETTFSFSRKVLDRAMSIEMNEVNYDSFLEDTTDNDLKAIVSKFTAGDLNKKLVEREVEAKKIVDKLDKASNVIEYLKTINHLLDGTPFKLGYRAANEALLYLKSTIDFGVNSFEQAMDNFTLMKILSRIEGDESKLRITNSDSDSKRLSNAGLNIAELGSNPTILEALRNIIVTTIGETYKLEEDSDDKQEEVQFKSIKKIDQMISQLNRDHFVSYWN